MKAPLRRGFFIADALSVMELAHAVGNGRWRIHDGLESADLVVGAADGAVAAVCHAPGRQPATAVRAMRPVGRRCCIARSGRARRRYGVRSAACRLWRAGRRRAVPAGLRCASRSPAPAHARRAGPAYRPGRVPSQLPRGDAGGHRARRRRPVVARTAAGRACRARGAVLPAPPGRAGQQLPLDHDPCRRAGAAACRRARGVGRQGGRAALRPARRADRATSRA